MNNLMRWKECEKEFVRQVEVDEERIKSIIETALIRLKTFEGIKLSKENSSFFVENHYEVIKELLVAYSLKNGLRSKNHQCLISYFYKKNPDYEKEAILISQMSFFRNRLTYYGEMIPYDFYIQNKSDFEKITKLILKLLE